MSIKKLLILSAAGLAAVSSAVAFAGGPDAMGPANAQPACSDAMYQPAFYIDADGGYNFANYNNFIGTSTATNNYYGSGVGGGDIGVQFNNYMGLELGSYYLGEVGNSTTGRTSYTVYGAGKFSVPVPYVAGLNTFAKVGVAWVGQNNNGSFPAATTTGSQDYWAPIFGAGFDYAIAQVSGLSVNLQWLRVSGSGSVTTGGSTYEKSAAPASDLLVAGLGYQVAL